MFILFTHADVTDVMAGTALILAVVASFRDAFLALRVKRIESGFWGDGK